jgi:hypothetical protein
MVMDAKTNPIVDGSETFNQFDIKLHLLNQICVKVVKVILNLF